LLFGDYPQKPLSQLLQPIIAVLTSLFQDALDQ